LGCIAACEKAISIDSNNAVAYNNICSSYNALAKYNKAKEACEQALKINPGFELAKNNLNLALQNLPN
jgi:tetratricopeptide (TPR) repeat protein